MLDLKVKILVMAILLFRIYQYYSGRFTGVSYRKLFIDFSYLGISVYILAYFKPFQDIWYIDIAITFLMIIFLIQLLFALRVYFVTKSYEINPEKRLLYLIEKLTLSQQWPKCYRTLHAHFEIVGRSAELTAYLGDAQKNQGEFEDAFESFAEASEFSTDEKLVLMTVEKGFLLCCNELKNTEKGFSFIQKIQARDLSPQFVEHIDQLMKKNS